MADTIVGSTGDDILTSDGVKNYIQALAGNDRIDLYNSEFLAETVDGGLGDDVINLSFNNVGYQVNLYDDQTGTSVRSGSGVTDVLLSIEGINGSNGSDTIVGSNRDEIFSGGGGVDNIDGGGGNDLFKITSLPFGPSSPSTLQGGVGVDTLSLGLFSSTGIKVDLQAGELTIDGVVKANVLGFENFNPNAGFYGGSVAYELVGNTSSNLLSGGANNDTIDGGAGADILEGQDGNDFLRGGLGLDTLNGGAGFDTVDYSNATGALSLTLQGATPVGARINGVLEDLVSGVENVMGGSGNDTLIGDAQANLFKGGGGRDGMDGGAGLDTADYSDMTGPISVTLNNATTVTVYKNGVWEDRIKNIEYIISGTGNDTLIGDAQNNLFKGGAGRDGMDGAGGSDTADYSDMAGPIAVTLNNSTVVTVYQSGVWEDRIKNIENIFGGTGADTLIGDAQNNSFRGGAGKDAMDGGAGNDTADYSERTSYYQMEVTLNGGTAASVMINGLLEDRIKNIENIKGGAGYELMNGDNLANQLDGGEGFDTLNGGLGNDTLTGGERNDVFLFKTSLGASNIDTITDFQTGTDRIHLDDDIFTALGTASGYGGSILAAGSFQLGTVANDVNDRIIYDQATGKLYYDSDGTGLAAQQQFALIGVATHPALTISDFLLVA